MIPTKNNGIRTGTSHFLDNSRVIHCTGSNPFEKNHFGLAAFLDELLHKGGKTLPIVALVVNDGDFLGSKDIQYIVGFHTSLAIIRGDCPEKIGIVTTLRQGWIGCRRRHGNDIDILVDTHGGLGRATTDMPHDHIDIFRNQLGGSIGSQFGFALIVLGNNHDLLAKQAALGVVLLGYQLSSIETWETI